MRLVCTAFSKSADGTCRDLDIPDEIARNISQDLGLPNPLSDEDILELVHNHEDIARLQQLVPSMLQGRRDYKLRPSHQGAGVSIQGTEGWVRNLMWHSEFPRSVVLLHAPESPMLRVISGRMITTVCIGGIRQYISGGQIPPQNGDSWSHGPFWLAAGTYDILVRGGVNAHHGKLRISLDDEEVTTEPQDWHCAETHFVVEQVIENVNISRSGPHTLTGTVDGASGSSHWMCLTEIEIIARDLLRELESTDVADANSLITDHELELQHEIEDWDEEDEFEGPEDESIDDLLMTSEDDYGNEHDGY